MAIDEPTASSDDHSDSVIPAKAGTQVLRTAVMLAKSGPRLRGDDG